MGLAKKNRLTKDKEFKTVFAKGRKAITPYYVLYIYDLPKKIDNEESNLKFGIIASKKVGNAVQRNRAKRLMREVIRLELVDIEKNKWVVAICRERILKTHIEILRSSIRKHFAITGIAVPKRDNK